MSGRPPPAAEDTQLPFPEKCPWDGGSFLAQKVTPVHTTGRGRALRTAEGQTLAQTGTNAGVRHEPHPRAPRGAPETGLQPRPTSRSPRLSLRLPCALSADRAPSINPSTAHCAQLASSTWTSKAPRIGRDTDNILTPRTPGTVTPALCAVQWGHQLPPNPGRDSHGLVPMPHLHMVVFKHALR